MSPALRRRYAWTTMPTLSCEPRASEDLERRRGVARVLHIDPDEDAGRPMPHRSTSSSERSASAAVERQPELCQLDRDRAAHAHAPATAAAYDVNSSTAARTAAARRHRFAEKRDRRLEAGVVQPRRRRQARPPGRGRRRSGARSRATPGACVAICSARRLRERAKMTALSMRAAYAAARRARERHPCATACGAHVLELRRPAPGAVRSFGVTAATGEPGRIEQRGGAIPRTCDLDNESGCYAVASKFG